MLNINNNLKQENKIEVPDSTDIVITGLSRTDFLKIADGSITYYSGNQNWFERYTQEFGGCGPTAAANILAYMAMTHPELEKLYDYDMENMTKTDFAKFMEEVYGFVTPLEVPVFNSLTDRKGSRIGIPSLGITSLSHFAEGLEKYAHSRGVGLKAKWNHQRLTFGSSVTYIKEGLNNDSPVALINMFNPVDMQWTDPETGKTITKTYERHWVTITGMTENKKTGEVSLEISSWGGKAMLSLNNLWNSMSWSKILFPAGAIYFIKSHPAVYRS